MSKFQLHATSMESLARCGIQFERRAINGERTPPNGRMALGTAVHYAVAQNLQSKIDTGRLLPVEQVRDIARDALVSCWNLGVRLSDEDGEEGIAGKGRALDMAVNLAGFHHAEVAPGITPTHVERKWVLDVAGLDLQVVGTIDVQLAGGIRDTKTSSKSPVKTLAADSLQLSAYALAVRQMDGAHKLPMTAALDYIIETPKRHELKHVALESARTVESLQPVLARLEQFAKIIKAGMFTPAPADSWACSKKFCPYWDSCRFAARPVSVAMAQPAGPSLEDQLAESIVQAKAAKV